MRRCSKMATRMEMVIKPRPPIWISSISTNCPKIVNWVQVSYSTSPVTQEAEAEVNNAFRKGMDSPDREEMGSISSTAPANIRQAKPMVKV